MTSWSLADDRLAHSLYKGNAMKALTAALVTMACMLAGCATTQDKDAGPTAAQVSADGVAMVADDGHAMTGSRMAKRTSTDRMVKSVGAQGAKDEMRNAPRPGAMTQ
jgi:outer membrane murein-binding lipoprotein Lpp